jgi:uncharacterized protein (TIGR00255 family)
MHSMTGMGTAEAKAQGVVVRVEMRSVNHRFLDLALRAPSRLGVFEPWIRERVASVVQRGRITLNLDLELAASRSEVTVNEEFVESYLKAVRKLARRHRLSGEIDIAHVASLPDTFTISERSVPAKLLKSLVGEAVDGALHKLDTMRAKEGRALVRKLSSRLKNLKSHLKSVESAAQDLPSQQRRRLEERLAGSGARDAVDPQRLAQEIVLLVERATITEETERLASHIAQFEDTLHGDGEGAKRLGFLLQEMHREVNTMGSKSTDLSITDRVVRMKGELEDMREQIQNLE